MPLKFKKTYKSKMPEPQFAEIKLPTPEEIKEGHEKYAKDNAHSAKVLFDAYITEGFTEEQAMTLLTHQQHMVVRY